MKIGIIGCGHMGSALARAALQKKLGDVWISNPHPKKIPGSHYTNNNLLAAQKTQLVILGVRPGDTEQVLKEIQPALTSRHILISIAAGISLKNLAKWSKNHKKIVRVMPNLAAQVGESISVWKAAKGLSQKEKTIVKKILNAFGKNIEVKDEKLIDTATAIAGGGPAYTAAFLESLAHAAQKAGFTKEQARFLAIEAVDGSLDYIKETGIEFGTLKKAVQTKGGTTEAGFKILKKKKWQLALQQALFAGASRARKISE